MTQPTETLSDLDAVVAKAQQDEAHRIKPKYLVNMGVFSAIYFVLVFASAMLGFVSPPVMFVGYALGIILNGTVIMLYLVKTPVLGALTVLGLVSSLLMAIMGHVWYLIIGCTALGLLGDLIVRSGNYRSKWRNILAYALVSLWYLIPWGPLLTDRAAYLDETAAQMGAEYTRAMDALVSPQLLAAWTVCVFLLGLLGAWIGTKILAKHFTKAGII